MFKVHIPSNILYVTPEQLPAFLATIASTKYVTESGEFVQTITWHEPSRGETTATLLIKSAEEALAKEADQWKDLYKKTRQRADRAEDKLAKQKAKCKVRK